MRTYLVMMFSVAWLFLAGCAGPASNRTVFASHQNPSELSRRGETVLPAEPELAPPPAREAARTAVNRPATVSKPPPAANDPVEAFSRDTWVPLKRWAASLRIRGPAVVALGLEQTFELQSEHGKLRLRLGQTVCTWNGMIIHLGFAPQMIGGEPFVHGLDMRKTLRPLLVGGLDMGLPADPVLVLDPGHGGVDSGTHGPAGEEKNFTLDWALRTADLLQRNGWRVVLTRTNDLDLSLSNRVAIANAVQADLFVSLHFNSAGKDPRMEGLETYCLTPKGLKSTLTREYSDDPNLAFPNNALDESNLRLAVRLHQALLGVNGGVDRGIRRARFMGVLRNQMRPAVLVEGGYLSNPRESARIADPNYRQRLAVALAEALLGRTLNGPTPVADPGQASKP